MGRDRNDTFFFFFFLGGGGGGGCSHYNCYHVSLVPAFSKCPKFALFVTKFTQDGYIYVTYPTVILVVVSHFIHSTSSLILSWMSKPLVFADWIMLPPLFILYAVRICFQNIKKLKILVMLENFQSLAYVGGDSIYFCLFLCFIIFGKSLADVGGDSIYFCLFLCFIIFGKWGSVFFRSRFLHHWVSTAVTHLNAMEYLSPSQGVRARAQDKFLLPCLPL